MVHDFSCVYIEIWMYLQTIQPFEYVKLGF